MGLFLLLSVPGVWALQPGGVVPSPEQTERSRHIVSQWTMKNPLRIGVNTVVVQESDSQGACSIPLINIKPRETPKMPTFKPPTGIDEGIHRLKMPAPPCEDAQREQTTKK